MNRLFLSFVVFSLLCTNAIASHNCRSGHHNCSHYGRHYSGSHSSSSSNPVYLVNKDYKTSEEHFADCNEHYMVVETTTYHYSDGTRRTFNNYTIYNTDGTILKNNCQDVHHLTYNKKHYFIVRENRVYSIINKNGESITERPYSWMEEVAPNRFLVRLDKKYGIIDLNEKLILDIKYQKFQRCSKNVFITKLNGYYGLTNTDGITLVKNDCEKIKPLYNTILLKRYGKYGLTDFKGKLIISPEQDKIKRVGEFIVVEKNKLYRVYNSHGVLLDSTQYKKVKLERNTLWGYTKNSEKVEIPTVLENDNL